MTVNRRLFLALAVSGAPFAAHAADPKVATIPFILTLDRAILLIGINGKGPFRFVIDTGDAAPMQITADLGSELKLPATTSGMTTGLVGQGLRGMLAADEVNFGGVLRQRHVGLVEIQGIKDLGSGTRGLVCSQFFMNAPTEIDFQARQVRVFLEGAPDHAGHGSVRLIRPENENDHKISVDASFGGAPCRLVLDTGAPSSLVLSPRFVARQKLWDAWPKFQSHQSGGLTGSAQARTTRATGKVLNFGPFAFRDPLVEMIDPAALAYGEHDGLIGLDILRRFTLSFDGPHGVLWLKPNDALSDAYRINRAGFELAFYPKRNEARVAAIVPGGPAAQAGLKVGDRIDGITSVGELDALRWRMRGYAGDPLELTVVRATGPEKVVVTLAEPF